MGHQGLGLGNNSAPVKDSLRKQKSFLADQDTEMGISKDSLRKIDVSRVLINAIITPIVVLGMGYGINQSIDKSDIKDTQPAIVLPIQDEMYKLLQSPSDTLSPGVEDFYDVEQQEFMQLPLWQQQEFGTKVAQ